ncbi:fungal protease inhibitor-1-like [Coccinella septempunctata]|uniref:fungal protease inhibitor-1-like n=1 Tax=Coccinella septempunctata TaxID=41139 RepID=UPI001D061179|nr:fungal protease inhibitor-1-like [Coccinella septempunctata]
MNVIYLTLFIWFCFFCGTASSLSCLSNACELEEVKAKCPPVPSKCPRGYALKPGGLCLCCKFCKKILYEGGNCASENPIAGTSSDKVVCADGLICKNRICQKPC